ncbi:MAG: alkaline phosphatase family protein [Chitinophagaceae bacterium]|nr:alkaline phosphatase family protein [Chitinophagaceae bacterium]
MRLILFGLFLFTSWQCYSKPRLERPKLVVGIVVDQMRPDFLYRYYDRYGHGGFKRLMKEGHECQNTLINYLPSYTGPGHAAIYTGSVPALHGISSNDWYERSNSKAMYCVADSEVKGVGGSDKAGKMSPKNLWANTITDELRLATNFKSKTIAISLKDRASILPGGHTSNGSYWLDDSLGYFMTSTFYMNDLPQWVQEFNGKKLAESYMNQGWNTLYPIQTYAMSTSDNNRYEGRYLSDSFPTFPHRLSPLKKSDIRKTCYGNDLIKDFALSALEGEDLGNDDITDFLCISFSSTDYVGHQFGPNSIEAEDCYLRLDKNLEEILNTLDNKYGRNNYTVFLTADHGAAHNPAFLNDHKMPGGFLFGRKLKDTLNAMLFSKFQYKNLIQDVSENYIWLSDSALSTKVISRDNLLQATLDLVKFMPEITFAVDINQVQQASIPDVIRTMALNGFVRKRSGDILLLLNPGWIDAYYKTGTTHGTWNPYDTHIPLLWFGWGIQPGTTLRETYMTDIAATLATLLHIQMPNSCIGKTITELIKP